MNSQIAARLQENHRPEPAMRRLVVDKAEVGFNPDTHLALGQWCFLGAEDAFPQWDSLDFIEPFDSARERCANNKAARQLAAALVDELYPELNRRHGTDYGRDFWHIVLFNWLLHLVMLSWRIWRHVELFAATTGDTPLEVPLPTATHSFKFRDTIAFVESCYSGFAFRDWLIGETIGRQVPPHWRLCTGARLTPPNERPRAGPAPIRRSPVDNINGMKWWQRRLLSLVTQLKSTKSARFGPLLAGDRSAFPRAYTDLVTQLARDTMPDSLREDFSRLDAEAKRQPYRRGRVHASSINIHDDQENIILAHAMLAGERIFAIQHGGAYGTAAILACAADLEYCHDTFITWGWTQQDDHAGRFLPLPSPLLARLEKARQPAGDAIVFVGTMMLAFNPRIDYCADPLEYRHWKRQFIAGLAPETRQRLRYRPYFASFSLNDGAWLRQSFPDLSIVEGDLYEELKYCRLAVLDYPGTTLAEVLAANIPTICFWNSEQWLLAPSAQPLFDRLRRAGILFNRPEDAAAQLNVIGDNIESWWKDPERQGARAEWCHAFARADRNWFAQWVRAFASE
jgi:hypothetical protein